MTFISFFSRTLSFRVVQKCNISSLSRRNINFFFSFDINSFLVLDMFFVLPLYIQLSTFFFKGGKQCKRWKECLHGGTALFLSPSSMTKLDEKHSHLHKDYRKFFHLIHRGFKTSAGNEMLMRC